MGYFTWIGAITRPKEYVQMLVKDRRNSADWIPGIRAVLWFELILTAVFAVLAWGILLALLALGWSLPVRWFWLKAALLGVWSSHLSPIGMIFSAVGDAVMLGVGFWLLSWFVDQCYERLFGSKTRRQREVFNLLLLCCLPLTLWAVLPVLGWILGAVEAVLISFWALQAIYKEDPFKTGATMIVSVFCVGVLHFALALVLAAGASLLPALPHWDPTQAWTQSLVARALPDDSGLSGLAAAFGGVAKDQRAVPTPAVTPQPGPLPGPTAAPAPAASAPVHRRLTQDEVNVKRVQTIEASSAQARGAVPAQDAAAPEPTPVPTAGSAAGQAIKDAAASVDKAAAAKQLLHLFGH